MTQAILDPARPTDARDVGLILSGWVDEMPWMPRIHTREQDLAHAAFLVGQGWVTVARPCGRVVGFLARDAGDIHALYITRAARGQGHGAALLNRAKAHAPTLSLWTFQANDGAQRFYLREGFHEVERTDGSGNDEGLPDIRYQWNKADE